MDYCHRKLTLLASKATREGATCRDQSSLSRRAGLSSMEVQCLHLEICSAATVQRFSRTHMTDMALLGLKELQMQNAELEFEISLKAVSVLRYITDHVERYGLVLMERGVDRSARPGFPQKCKHFDFLFICWFCFLSFSISVINRLLCTHNMPCVLVQLVDCCPWMRYTEGLSQLQRLLFWSLKRTLTDPCSFWLPLEVSWRST